MLSNSQKKYVNSLKQKKYRTQYSSFVVEGEKMIHELLKSSYEVEHLFGTEPIEVDQFVEVSEKELASISSLKAPNKFLAVVKQKENIFPSLTNQFSIVLDNVQDPGNLGTIIRIADWFGIKNVVCSLNCVDVYNSKVIQATMGSLFRVDVTYVDLLDLLNQTNKLTVYGAALDGSNIYKTKMKQSNAVLLMGNESKGISDDLKPFITHNISIPQFGEAESLNVAVATAILCSECRRAD